MHEPKQPNYAGRILLCDWLPQIMHDRVMVPHLLLITDEAYIYVSGYVSTKNT
jgi:hypothetical protein